MDNKGSTVPILKEDAHKVNCYVCKKLFIFNNKLYNLELEVIQSDITLSFFSYTYAICDSCISETVIILEELKVAHIEEIPIYFKYKDNFFINEALKKRILEYED